MFGKIANGCCELSAKMKTGFKPIEYTKPEEREGYTAVFKFTDNVETIVQEWRYIKDDTPKEPTTEDKAEAYDILTGVNA